MFGYTIAPTHFGSFFMATIAEELAVDSMRAMVLAGRSAKLRVKLAAGKSPLTNRSNVTVPPSVKR